MSWLRLGFAIAGFILALLSVTLSDQRLAWAAIASLAVSLIVRLVLRKRSERESPPDRPV
jgi:membrane protein implicated in regulation of membrane protease activity